MSPNRFFVLLVISILQLGTTASCSAKQPNLLFILVDDLGYMDVSPYNPETFYETPNIQALAENSLRFTNGYTASQVCSPTRASILTGKYPARMKTTEWFGGNRKGKLLSADYLDYLPLEEVTLAETLCDEGYATIHVGKWHLGGEGHSPEDQGFDLNKGGTHLGAPHTGNKYFSPYGNPKLEDGPKGEHLPDRLANETINFMRENKDTPFFVHLAFYSVHTPLIGRPDLVKKYKKKAKLVDKDIPRWKKEHRNKARQVQEHAVYAAMVEAMDLAVGKVLDELKALNLEEDTVVIFFSDNGGLSTAEGSPTSNLPLRAGKGWMYEGGVRVPCLIHAPGITKPGTVCEEPIISNDFYPTFLELAELDAKPEQHLDGISLAPLLSAPKSHLDRNVIYWHYPHNSNQGGAPSGAIRRRDWKLIERFEDGSTELYNLSEDVGELHDLSGANKDLVIELLDDLHQWQKSVDANMPKPNPDWRPKRSKK